MLEYSRHGIISQDMDRFAAFARRICSACRTLYSDGLLSGRTVAENDTGLDIDDIESVYMNQPGNHFWVAQAD